MVNFLEVLRRLVEEIRAKPVEVTVVCPIVYKVYISQAVGNGISSINSSVMHATWKTVARVLYIPLRWLVISRQINSGCFSKRLQVVKDVGICFGAHEGPQGGALKKQRILRIYHNIII